MNHRCLATAGTAFLVITAFSSRSTAQSGAGSERGPYARIAIMHPLDGHMVDFEAGYIRHLAWHEQARDTWTWYGWTVNCSERRLWFIYASFGHSAASLDNPVDPAGDDRDNMMNVAPHVDHWGNALYEYLPALSRGTGVPQPAARVELTTVDLNAGTEGSFEVALTAAQSTLKGETLWYRIVAGGTAPRYIRLRPRPSMAAVIDGKNEPELPDNVNALIVKTTIEILNLRPTMSYGVAPTRE
jgi:hypothetical protein